MKIFVISDTHDKIITPPVEYDASIHLGDCCNYFSKQYNTLKAALDAFRSYTYAVIGNHEHMLLQALTGVFENERILTALDYNVEFDYSCCLRQLRRQPVKKINIDGVKMRLSHYIIADPVDVATEPSNEPFAVLNIAKAAEFNIVAYGHTHFQFEQKIGGVWFLNPGNGERGEYAIINIENSKIISIELKTL